MEPKYYPIFKERLRHVVQALLDVPPSALFSMSEYVIFGLPSCAFAYYADRSDLQCQFKLDLRTGKALTVDGREISYPREIAAHFGLTDNEVDELFGTVGCADARTAVDAAAYIKTFIDHHPRFR